MSYYKDIMPWMQYVTGSTGNSSGFTGISGNFDYRYGNYYSNVGLALADIPHLIANMTPAQQAARQYEAAIASIYMAYYTFYVSDINGSIPYSQAFQGRYGGTLTPVYDTQQSIFDTLDTQIKNAVAVLESSPSTSQVLYGGNDPFFGTASNQALQWVKAGNALRLKIAMRQIKRSPVCGHDHSPVGTGRCQPDVFLQRFMGELYVGNAFAVQGGNFDPTGFLASAPIINFMNTTGDPRIRHLLSSRMARGCMSAALPIRILAPMLIGRPSIRRRIRRSPRYSTGCLRPTIMKMTVSV